MGVTIVITDQATPVLAQLGTALRAPAQLNRAAVEGAIPLVQRTFVEKATSEQNAFGARSTFWNRMIAGTTATANAEMGTIRVPREIALRFFGGTVKPKKAKLLAIPARAEAYGMSPRQFSDLRFVPTRRGGMLVQNDQTQTIRYRSGRQKGEVKERREVGGGVFFYLVPEVTISPDQSVLPTQAALQEGALRGVQSFVDLQMRRAQS